MQRDDQCLIALFGDLMLGIFGSSLESVGDLDLVFDHDTGSSVRRHWAQNMLIYGRRVDDYEMER